MKKYFKIIALFLLAFVIVQNTNSTHAFSFMMDDGSADSIYNLTTNVVTLNYTSYPSYVTTPTIYQQEVNGNFAWVKARTYFSLGSKRQYCYGEHGAYKSDATLVY